jgi:hypothetical protein
MRAVKMSTRVWRFCAGAGVAVLVLVARDGARGSDVVAAVPETARQAAPAPSVLAWGDLEVAILGWQTVAEAPRGLSLRPGEMFLGVSYLAVNVGNELTGFSAIDLLLRDASGTDYRINMTATSLLAEGSLGAQLLPGEPLSGVAWYKVARHGDLAVVRSRRGARSRQTEGQGVPLSARPGLSPAPQDVLARIRPPAAPAGQTVDVDGWGVRVLDAHAIGAVGNARPSSSEKALAVTVEATNRAREARRLTPSDMLLKDATGRVFAYRGDPDPGSGERAARAALGGHVTGGLEAAPGAALTVQLGFLVPAEATGLMLAVDPVATEPGKALLRLPRQSAPPPTSAVRPVASTSLLDSPRGSLDRSHLRRVHDPHPPPVGRQHDQVVARLDLEVRHFL